MVKQAYQNNIVKQSYLHGAIELAKRSQMEHQHGAVLFSGGAIYGRGTNTSNRSRFNRVDRPSVHAEMSAIMNGPAKDLPYLQGGIWRQRAG